MEDTPASPIENVFGALIQTSQNCDCLSVFFFFLFFHGEMSNGCVMLDENNLCSSCPSLLMCVCVYKEEQEKQRERESTRITEHLQ